MRSWSEEEINAEAMTLALEEERYHQKPTIRLVNGDARHDDEPKKLVSTCASEVGLESVQWIWKGRLAKGTHICIAGEPGTGKSQLSMSIAATVTMGGAWPCGEGKSPQGSVLILSAADGAADTIAPRLHAAEADLGSVHIVSSVMEGEDRRTFNLQHDLALLEKECKRIGDVVLIIVDPVSSYLGKTDSHKNAEVRGVLEPLGMFAERMGVAVLSITHFSKAGVGSAPATGAKEHLVAPQQEALSTLQKTTRSSKK